MVSPGGKDTVGFSASAGIVKLARHKATAKRREGMIVGGGRKEGGAVKISIYTTRRCRGRRPFSG
jgi:hypothetical protein